MLKRLFVIDTNVLMHDPACLFSFHEHDVYLPMAVIEELDANKKGLTETARNARQASRFLDELLQGKTHDQILQGILLIPQNKLATHQAGRLFFQTSIIKSVLPDHTTDNVILAVTLALQQEKPDSKIVLVSKDLNLRLKASIIGIYTEDYYSDRMIHDTTELRAGWHLLPENFWDIQGKNLESWQIANKTFYKITRQDSQTQPWHLNDGLYLLGDNRFSAIVRDIQEKFVTIECTQDYQIPKHRIWGVNARNIEQNFALHALMDPVIDLVTLQGPAGTGKTLLTLATGLMQTLTLSRYHEIIMTRVTVPLGEDIGFLPGTEEEKMTPWMGALMDNLDVLHHALGTLDQSEKSDNKRQYYPLSNSDPENDLAKHRIKIRSLNFMRGRTFFNKYVIIDEAQNLTSKQIKTLLTRAGVGTKIVCLGDLKQIDTPYLTENTSGLAYAIENFKNWAHSAHITLTRGERSRLADYAANHL